MLHARLGDRDTRAGQLLFQYGIAALKDPTSTNTTYAVGRYAYAVYDEGGLLDINVAGYPIPSTCASTRGTTRYWQEGRARLCRSYGLACDYERPAELQ